MLTVKLAELQLWRNPADAQRSTATTQMSVKGPWRGFHIRSVQFNTSVCVQEEALHGWSVAACKRSPKSKRNWEAQFQYLLRLFVWNKTRPVLGVAWKAGVLSALQVSVLPTAHILTQLLFEEASIEQLWMTGPSFGLQAEEQVPEVDSGDALSHKLSAAGSAGASGLRGPRPWALGEGTRCNQKRY